jgi:hypothetical protein
MLVHAVSLLCLQFLRKHNLQLFSFAEIHSLYVCIAESCYLLLAHFSPEVKCGRGVH